MQDPCLQRPIHHQSIFSSIVAFKLKCFSHEFFNINQRELSFRKCGKKIAIPEQKKLPACALSWLIVILDVNESLNAPISGNQKATYTLESSVSSISCRQFHPKFNKRVIVEVVTLSLMCLSLAILSALKASV